MNSWFAHHLVSLTDALRRLLRTPFASLLTALAIGVAITLPVGLYLTLENLDRLAGDLPTQPEISLFVSGKASQAQRDAIGRALERHVEIRTRRYISSEEALAHLKSQGLADITAGLDRNPLPDAWVLTPRQSGASTLEALKDELSALPGVESVHADSAWAQRLQAILRIGEQAVLLLAGLFGLALVAIASNAIRSQILARQEEIEVSRLIGATDRFIRRPFLYFGALQGATGAVAALAMIGVLGLALDGPVGELASLYGSPFRLAGLSLAEIALILAGATLFSWLGAWIAVGRSLRKFD